MNVTRLFAPARAGFQMIVSIAPENVEQPLPGYQFPYDRHDRYRRIIKKAREDLDRTLIHIFGVFLVAAISGDWCSNDRYNREIKLTRTEPTSQRRLLSEQLLRLRSQ